MTISDFSRELLSWYRANRRDLPWRHDVTPYRTWISEIMLQQTRVEAVKGYFTRFLSELPTVYELASVPDEVLMKLWQGLGYYSRARNLKKAAMEIVSRYGGELPERFDELLSLPGIGRYTAAAITSIAYGKRESAVDGNVLRVYARVFGDRRDIAEEKTRTAYESAVRALMPEESGRYGEGENDCGDFTQGMIELGATVCVPNGKPFCEKCPFAELCVARKDGTWSELPVKMKKAPRRIEQRTVLLLTDGTRFGLVKRPETGLLAGLFEPLCVQGTLGDAAIRAYLVSLGFDGSGIGEIAEIGKSKHIFTHIEWHMTGYLVGLRDLSHRAQVIFCTYDEIVSDYAVPSAYRDFMKYIGSLRSDEGRAT